MCIRDRVEAIQQVNRAEVPALEVQLSTGFTLKRHFAVLISNFSADEKNRTAITLIDRTLAMESEKMRSDFVANVSHELRTPLTSILGFVETLQGPAGAEEKTREKFLTILKQQAERIFRLATDQLSLARIEQTEQHSPQDKCDLGMICSRVVTLLETQAKAADIRLDFEAPEKPLIIKGNQDELVQMIQNLAENGIRYGHPDGQVSITLEHFMRNQGRVYSRDQFLDSVWGDDVYVGMRTVDVHIRRLRKAINITGGPDVIRTVRSMGYSFETTE